MGFRSAFWLQTESFVGNQFMNNLETVKFIKARKNSTIPEWRSVEEWFKSAEPMNKRSRVQMQPEPKHFPCVPEQVTL
jgi:hypothetical protein